MIEFISHRAIVIALAILCGAAAAHAQCDSTNKLSGSSVVVSAAASRPHLTPLVLAPYPEVGRPLTWFWTVHDSDLADFLANEEIQLAVLAPADFAISRKRVRGPLDHASDTFAIGTLALPSVRGPLQVAVTATDRAGHADTVTIELCVSDRTIFDLPLVITTARKEERYLHLAIATDATTNVEAGGAPDPQYCENELATIVNPAAFDARWAIDGTNGVERIVQPNRHTADGLPIRSRALLTADSSDYPIHVRYYMHDLRDAPFDLKLWDSDWDFTAGVGRLVVDMQTLRWQSEDANFGIMGQDDSVTLIFMSPPLAGFVIGPAVFEDMAVDEEQGGRLSITVTPTPTSGAARIAFLTERPGPTRVEIFTANGAHVRTLFDDHTDAGMREVVWDGTDASGRACPSGHYRSVVTSADTERTARIVLIR